MAIEIVDFRMEKWWFPSSLFVWPGRVSSTDGTPWPATAPLWRTGETKQFRSPRESLEPPEVNRTRWMTAAVLRLLWKFTPAEGLMSVYHHELNKYIIYIYNCINYIYIYINRPTYSICIPFGFHHVSFLKYQDWYSGLWCKPDLPDSTM